jgi:hypothetical protein
MICNTCLVRSTCINPCEEFQVNKFDPNYIIDNNMVNRLCKKYTNKKLKYLRYTILINNYFISFRLNGERHREDGPAFIYANGREEWYLHGKRHREDGPAIIYPNGSEEWWLHGEHHRDDGPAFIYADGTEEWWLHGKLHREDGPAIIYADGTEEWWLNNKHYRGKRK